MIAVGYYLNLQHYNGGETYLGISIDFNGVDENCKVKVYSNGELIEETTCSEKYLKLGEELWNVNIPFTIGVIVAGDPIYADYSKFDLYACRLYTRVLSDTEIAQNYTATTDYHNELVK